MSIKIISIDSYIDWPMKIEYIILLYNFWILPSRSKDKVNQARDENQCINLQKGFIQMAMPLDNTLAIHA